ncbi:head-tail adaptor protein [Luteimonas sp. XNQY3]|nr:head-tail adaptor protein [Luteimonas sp. XNQY3]MCD9005227.1 head-tail adaptor protein [Luteimonas sp. XNQY3]
MTRLTAGERRHRIRFERPVTVENDFGEIVGTGWEPVIEVWAKRTNQLSATTEAVASGAQSYREQVRFDILPREVASDWRIVDRRGRIYDIRSVGTSNDGSETAVIAVSGLNQG